MTRLETQLYFTERRVHYVAEGIFKAGAREIFTFNQIMIPYSKDIVVSDRGTFTFITSKEVGYKVGVTETFREVIDQITRAAKELEIVCA